ncbi:hypothetical protein GCM10009566_65980 [Streptomyces murinus]
MGSVVVMAGFSPGDRPVDALPLRHHGEAVHAAPGTDRLRPAVVESARDAFQARYAE